MVRILPLLFLIAACSLSAPAFAEGGASDVVRELHGTMRDVSARANELGFEGRVVALSPAVEEAFDLPGMARRAAGRYWKTLSEEQQAALVERFVGLSIATYAARLDRPSRGRFEIRAEEPSDHDTVIVRTAIVPSDPEEKEISLVYQLRESEGAFRIIDVFLNGTISEVALRRSEYTSVLGREGFDALVAALDRKIDGHGSVPANR